MIGKEIGFLAFIHLQWLTLSLSPVVQGREKHRLAAHDELTDENNPVVACKEKAVYLLRFAGLTRVQLKNEVSVLSGKLFHLEIATKCTGLLQELLYSFMQILVSCL